MEDQPPTAPPASEPFPGSLTPGWNDPPQMQYNPNGAGSSRPRLNLNRRVAFPLQGTVSGSAGAAAAPAKPTAIVPPNSACACSIMPPPVALPPGVPGGTIDRTVAVVHPMPSRNAQPVNARVPATAEAGARPGGAVIPLPAVMLEYSLAVLRERAECVEESPNVRREEIERRLGIIEQLWQSGNLSAAVQEKIYGVAIAVAEKRYNEAIDIYSSLVANHASECTTWAVALRHVVLTLQRNIPETTTTSSSENSNIAVVVPAMSVPAVPRQAISNETTANREANTAVVTGYSSVQHI